MIKITECFFAYTAEGLFITQSNIEDGAFPEDSHYLFLQKTRSEIFDLVLNAPLDMSDL